MCFTRKGDKRENVIRIEDSLWLRKAQLEKFDEWVRLKIFIHHPGQVLRVFDAPTFVSTIKDFDWEKPELRFKISQVNILRKRPDANNPCDPNLSDDDHHLRTIISKKVGCIPVYWKNIMSTKLRMKTCNSPKDMEKIWTMLQNFTRIHSMYPSPCNEMKLSAMYDQHKTENPWNDGYSSHQFLKMNIKYMDKSYQEIVNEREFGFESLWSTVGGFIGIFVGVSLSQAPSLVAHFLTWTKNLIK